LKEAQINELNIHSKKLYNPIRFTDLTNDKNIFNKYTNMLVPKRFKMGQSFPLSKLDAFVDAVIGPTKFRIRLLKEKYIVNLFLSGTNALSNDPNGSD